MEYFLKLKNKQKKKAKKFTHLGISDSILRSLPNMFSTITFPISENMHIKLTVKKYIPKRLFYNFNYV